MRILITNDDGIEAPGLDVLEKIATDLTDDVWVVAPETDQSGAAHSLTLAEPLRMRELSRRHYAVKGTPTDCVIMGVRYLLRQQAARPGSVGRQSRPESRRRRELFWHRSRRHRRNAARHPIHRHEPRPREL